MVIVKLQGGLGNQMFQYAFGRSIAKKLHTAVYFDPSFFDSVINESDISIREYELSIFDADVNFADTKLIRKFLQPDIFQRLLNKLNIYKKTIYNEPSLRMSKEVFNIKPSAYLSGFWHSEKYFWDIEEEIRELFIFRKPLNELSQKFVDKISEDKTAVSVHIRRGDYISSERTNQIHGSCTIEYYKNALALIKMRLNSPHFYFFSDELEWVKNNLINETDNCTLVDHNRGKDSWQDMALMSRCKHHIIANSSFSWWGAWINPNKEKIVIAPKSWFRTTTDYFNAVDFLPKNWTQLENE